MTGTSAPIQGSVAVKLASRAGTTYYLFAKASAVLHLQAEFFTSGICCCRLVVMSATLGGGVGPKVAQLLAQALPQQYKAVGVAEAGLGPAQAHPGGRTAAQTDHSDKIVTSEETAGGVAAPFLVSQGRSFRVRTEYLGLPGAAAGDGAGCTNVQAVDFLDVP